MMLSHRRRLAPMLLGLLLAAGCAEPKRDIRTRLLVQPQTAAELGYRIQWPADLGLRGRQRILYAELLGDRLVTFESGNVASVIHTTTGRVLWRTEVGSELERFGAPRRAGDRLVLCSERRCHIYDLETGGLLKVIPLAHVSSTTPLVHNERMIHGSPSGAVFAQDLAQGLTLWTFNIGGAAAADPVLCGPYVVIPATGGWVFAFNPDTGDPVWRANTWGDIAAPTAATDSAVFVASEDRSLYAFARSTGRTDRKGRELWRYYTESRLNTRPYIFGDNVYQYVPDRGMVAIDAATGKELWALPWDDARPFMLKGGQLYVLRPGEVAVVKPEDGLVLKTIAVPAVHDIIPTSPTGGDLYLIRLNGKILKLVPI